MTRELDVVIFGATGFTGKYTVLHAVKLLSDLKWGIAGRSQQKLESVLKEMGKKADTDLSKVPIIIADVGDEASLEKMARQTKVSYFLKRINFNSSNKQKNRISSDCSQLLWSVSFLW